MAVTFACVLQQPVRHVLGRARFRPLSRSDAALVAAGEGFLAGSFPDGITTDGGVPTAALVRVLVRSENVGIDGVLLRVVQSAESGVWHVPGLHPGLRFDVVARKSGRCDVIASDVKPVV